MKVSQLEKEFECEDDAFVRGFETLKLPLSEFNHAAHVRLAWCYLRTFELPEAMIQFRDGLKRFALFHGKAGLYHETITFAFLLLIHERMNRIHCNSQEVVGSWKSSSDAYQDFIQDGKAILLRGYSEEVLFSERAKSVFYFPDKEGSFDAS